jgi:hypothetical protein
MNELSFFDQSDLLYRLSRALIQRRQEVVFLVGSAFSAPIKRGASGIPDANGLIELIRLEFADDSQQIAGFDAAIAIDPNRRALYRHAHATGLFAKRDRNIRRALGLIIHRADEVLSVTADSVIRALKMLTHINAHGQWVQPPTHVVFSTATNQSGSLSRAQSRRANPESHADDSIDRTCQLKNRLKP